MRDTTLRETTVKETTMRRAATNVVPRSVSSSRAASIAAAVAALLAAAASSAALAAPAPPLAEPNREAASAPQDSAEVAETVRRFHDALASGDSASAMDLLAEDATILEAGGLETRAEYEAHHLGADIAFASAVPRERGEVAVTVEGDVAWAVSTSRAEGEFRGREVRSQGAELMVLRRGVSGWEIVAIHWSSRPIEGAGL